MWLDRLDGAGKAGVNYGRGNKEPKLKSGLGNLHVHSRCAMASKKKCGGIYFLLRVMRMLREQPLSCKMGHRQIIPIHSSIHSILSLVVTHVAIIY